MLNIGRGDLVFRNNKKIKQCRKEGASYLCKKEICNLNKDSIQLLKNDLIQARDLLSDEIKKYKDDIKLPTYGLFVCDDGMIIGKPTKRGDIKVLFFNPVFTDKGEVVTSQRLENYIDDKKHKIKHKKADQKLVEGVHKVLESISSKSSESPKVYTIDNIYDFNLEETSKNTIYAFKKIKNKADDDISNIGIVYNTCDEWMVSFFKADKLNNKGQFVEAQILRNYLKI